MNLRPRSGPGSRKDDRFFHNILQFRYSFIWKRINLPKLHTLCLILLDWFLAVQFLFAWLRGEESLLSRLPCYGHWCLIWSPLFVSFPLSWAYSCQADTGKSILFPVIRLEYQSFFYCYSFPTLFRKILLQSRDHLSLIRAILSLVAVLIAY